MSATVLIVEDDENLARALQYSLETAGFQVQTTNSGTQGVAKAREERPDAVILDIMLPDMDGFEVCRLLRAAPQTSHVAVIMLSARTQTEDKIAGLEAGADDYVIKPFDVQELVARVTAHVERVRRLRSAEQGKPAPVIAVLGAKGGVGTTTVAVNLALSLAQKDKTAIVAELRACFGTMAVHLGLTPRVSWADLFELPAAAIDESQVRRQLATYTPLVRALLGPQSPEDYRTVSPEQVEALLRVLSRLADDVVLDLACHPSELLLAALPHCQRVLLVLGPEQSCLQSAKMLLQWQMAHGISRNAVRVVVVNRAHLAAPIPYDQIASALECEILGQVAALPDIAARAIQVGRPMVVSAPQTVVTEAFAEIARRLMVELQ